MHNKLSTQDARAILGIPDDVELNSFLLKEYYLKTVKRVHPDAGGNDFLAKQVNQANELLEEHIKVEKKSYKFASEDAQTNKMNGNTSSNNETDPRNDKAYDPTDNHNYYAQEARKSSLRWIFAFILLILIIFPKILSILID